MGTRQEISQDGMNEVRREKGILDLFNTREQLMSAKARQQKEKAVQKLPGTTAAEPRSSGTSSLPTSSTRMGKIYQVVVNGIRGEKVTIDLCNTDEQMKSMTVRQLKEKVAQKLPGTASLDNLRLIFTDKALEGDTDMLSQYGIQHMSIIHIVVKVPGGLTA